MPFDQVAFSDVVFDFIGGTPTPPEPLPPAAALGTAFDPEVFDSGSFDALYTVPFMQKCVVYRPFRRLRFGSTVAIPITLYIQEGDSSPGRLYSMNPLQGVYMQVYYPTGEVRRSYTFMTNVRTGVYTYRHVTSGADPKGCYSGNFWMVNGDKMTVTENQFLFEVV